jgi:hypothetical protein
MAPAWAEIARRAWAALRPAPRMCPDCGDALASRRVWVLGPGGGRGVTAWDCVACAYTFAHHHRRRRDCPVYGVRRAD